jgi:hypothetical protein
MQEMLKLTHKLPNGPISVQEYTELSTSIEGQVLAIIFLPDLMGLFGTDRGS